CTSKLWRASGPVREISFGRRTTESFAKALTAKPKSSEQSRGTNRGRIRRLNKKFLDRLRPEIHQREWAAGGAGEVRIEIEAEALENRGDDHRGIHRAL